MRRKPPDNPISVSEFGRALLAAKDLDPVYAIIWNARLGGPTLRRLLLAYFCFYHLRTAAWVAARPVGYWTRMRAAAGSKEYPRCTERRHFRGAAAVKSVAYLESRGVDGLFADLMSAGPTAADVTSAIVKNWVGFGPWIAFKVADVLERLDIRPVRFDLTTVLYDSPRKAADTVWGMCGSPPEGAGRQGEWALDKVLADLGPVPAPPRGERVVGPAEAETVLCKYGSYLMGHYQVGEDVAGVKAALGWRPECRLAARLCDAGGRAGLW